jgi:Ca2+-binding RTX toxin-like protein
MALLSSILTGGVLTYTFDGAGDTAFVRQTGGGNTFLSLTSGGTPIAGSLFLTSSVNSIVVDAGAGNDTINATSVLATTPLTLIGEAGNDTLTGNGGANTIYGDSDTPDATTALSFTPASTVTGAGNSRTVATNFTLTATGGSFVNRTTSQGGVSEAGYGVFNLNDSGVPRSRGIDGDTANGNATEQLAITFVNTNTAAVSATVVLGVNTNTFTTNNDYIIEGFNNGASLGTITLPMLTGGPNTLTPITVNFGNQLFDELQVRNFLGTEAAFVISSATFNTVDETSFGNDTINGGAGADFLYGGFGDDTFDISNARDAFGDNIYGGFGTDTVKNVTTAETVVLTDFRTTGTLGTQTVFGVEQFDGGGKSEIRGRDAAFDGVGNDTDALDFTGITFISGVTTINLRSGDDKYIGGNTALTVNGGSGDDILDGGVGGGTLNGEAGSDTLIGGTAPTTLNGGAGVDKLYVGVGATTFDFNIFDTNNAKDSVFGFTSGYDIIKLNTSIYGQVLPLSVAPGTGPSGTGAASEIRYQTIGSNTTIYLPGTGSNAFRSILLDGFSDGLSAADFSQV